MVRPNRIKEYRFSTTELTAVGSYASALGSETISAYSSEPLNGIVQSVEFIAGNYNATGSVGILVSGTNENILVVTSGTVANLGANQSIYPHVFTVDSSNATGSPDAFTQRVINGHLCVWGSGLGTGSSASGLNIKYI